MIRAFLRSKIHRTTVTHVDIEYEGSLSLGEDLMTAAGLWPFERIDVWNVSNGERFSTYIIRGGEGLPPGRGLRCRRPQGQGGRYHHHRRLCLPRGRRGRILHAQDRFDGRR